LLLNVPIILHGGTDVCTVNFKINVIIIKLRTMFVNISYYLFVITLCIFYLLHWLTVYPVGFLMLCGFIECTRNTLN